MWPTTAFSMLTRMISRKPAAIRSQKLARGSASASETAAGAPGGATLGAGTDALSSAAVIGEPAVVALSAAPSGAAAETFIAAPEPFAGGWEVGRFGAS